MRKFAIFAAGIMAAATLGLSTGAAAEESDTAEQVILRLSFCSHNKKTILMGFHSGNRILLKFARRY